VQTSSEPREAPATTDDPFTAHPYRRHRLAVVVLAIVLVGAGIWLADALVNGPPTVAVVGDSITALSRASIATALARAGYQPLIEATPGVKMSQAASAMDQLSAQIPADWIIELGTNDAGANNLLWPEAFLAEWEKVSSSHCVIYVSVSPRAGPIAGQIDASLEGLAGRSSNVHVLDWGHLEYSQPGWVGPDTIHPTPAGQLELANLEARALRNDC
jgi:hypothetical protein